VSVIERWDIDVVAARTPILTWSERPENALSRE